ncbi:MAG TPA: DJ-1/PfpI family protein [Pseudonocardiaceae bacterium]|nr:DJ-1/PfpI family protein [Pseudonocardiaceae bacterium]
MSRVAFLLVPGLHLLDLAGPAQVFASALDLGFDYRLSYLAEAPTVPTAQGLPVCADTDWPELTSADLIVVPGWRASRLAGTGPLAASTLSWLRAHFAAGGTVASVCRAPMRWVGPGCWTVGVARPTTTSRTNWPAATRRPGWCATCCTWSTAG